MCVTALHAHPLYNSVNDVYKRKTVHQCESGMEMQT